MMNTKHPQPTLLIRALLSCGIASSLIYAVTEIIASQRYAGYVWTARMVSDLFAVSAPTRDFVTMPMLGYNVLIMAFGAGVWLRSGNRLLRWAGVTFVAYGIAGMLGFFIFSLDYTVKGSGADMHMVMTFLLILFMFAFIVLAAVGSGRAFRIYSAVTTLVIIGGAAMAGSQIPKIEAHMPTPGLGIWERLNIYSMLLWVAVFAVMLMRGRIGSTPADK